MHCLTFTKKLPWYSVDSLAARDGSITWNVDGSHASRICSDDRLLHIIHRIARDVGGRRSGIRVRVLRHRSDVLSVNVCVSLWPTGSPRSSIRPERLMPHGVSWRQARNRHRGLSHFHGRQRLRERRTRHDLDRRRFIRLYWRHVVLDRWHCRSRGYKRVLYRRSMILRGRAWTGFRLALCPTDRRLFRLLRFLGPCPLDWLLFRLFFVQLDHLTRSLLITKRLDGKMRMYLPERSQGPLICGELFGMA
jgi:hypothetical protein